MRIVIPNLHANFMMLTTASVYIFKFSPAVKHNYLLKYLLDRPDVEVCTYLNNRSFSIFTKGPEWLQRCLRKTLSRIEMRWIFKKNDISSRQVTVLKGPEEVSDNDIVLAYNICRDEYDMLEKARGLKALCMIHFGGNATENALIEKAGIACYYNEANLSQTSAIFQKYYHVDRPWLIIPFVFAKRFKNLQPFSARKNRAFSVGTITYKANPEFLSVYGDPCDQPIRKLVKDNPDYFADTVDCYSQDYLEDDDVKVIKENDNPLTKTYKRIHNRFHTGRQKKYFSFDMVEKFNEYKMHIVGEEILGVPGIGFVEGMACGSAYIGIDSPMYRDLGLIPGEHHISYDGTKEGLRATIEYWQRPENQQELERIAADGCRFVRENFCGPKVAERLVESLLALKK